MTSTRGQAIDTLFLEERRYPPPEEFARNANAQPEIYQRDPDEFWETEGRERVTWFEPFTKLCEWEQPYAKWYVGGKLNVTYNCVDRHVEAGRGDRVAYLGGQPGLTAARSHSRVAARTTKLANPLKSLGVRRDAGRHLHGHGPRDAGRDAACARIGAPHRSSSAAAPLALAASGHGVRVLITRQGLAPPAEPRPPTGSRRSPTVKNVSFSGARGGCPDAGGP